MGKIGLVLWLACAHAFGSFYMDYKLNYQTETDGGDASPFKYNRMMNGLYLAASMDRDKQFFIGQSVIQWSKTQLQGNDTADEIKMSLLELGPRLHYYFTQNKTWYTSFTYNFYAKGKSTVANVQSDISGSGYLASLGYHYKLTRTIGIGGSINYHSVTIDERKVDSSTSDVSETYTAVVPMLELAMRFR